jgi:hypothetical protein
MERSPRRRLELHVAETETEAFIAPRTFPSVDDASPAEEGGPDARRGFNYQDEIAVSFFIEMLEEESILKVHCESHDDIVLVRGSVLGARVAEYVQVKAGEPDKLWSVADLCAPKNRRPGSSLFETSLARDAHSEDSLFRIVTLTRVVTALKVLTVLRDASGRTSNSEAVALQAELERRFPELKSEKGNGAGFWIQNCMWDERDSEDAVRRHNLIRLLKLGHREGKNLLPEQIEQLLDELRMWAKTAGALRWRSDRDRKIITRDNLRDWWETRTHKILIGASSPAGGKLAQKLEEARLPPDIVALAIDLRLHYSAAVRTARYMSSLEEERLRYQIKSAVISLRAQFVAGQIQGDGVAFHAICLQELDALSRAASVSPAGEDRAAFIKGCMYDITDRCLLRFARPEQ